MRTWSAVAALLLVATVLAGCSDAATDKKPVDASFDDIKVQATATTGVIRGVVVDERIVPIADATIFVNGGETTKEAVSDKSGRFAFDGLTPGTYFLTAKHLLHQPVQTTVEVVAGVSEPPVTKVLMTRLFAQTAFHEQYQHDAFIQCNQAGAYYASAPCVTDFSGIGMGSWPAAAGNRPCPPTRACCTAAGCFQELRRIQEESRGFTVPLGAGWQTLIWEMTWKATSSTFTQLGLTVSYNETERCACHNYASTGSLSPYRLQIDLGVDHPNSNSAEPNLIDENGLPAMYYFIGARASPALVVNQKVAVFSTFFYYGVPPEGWSFVNGDAWPF